MSLISSLLSRSILLTGCSGFLGKVLLCKILTSVSSVGRVYVLVRPRSDRSAADRVASEIRDSEVFHTLRTTMGKVAFENLFASKVVAVEGEMTYKDCGIKKEVLEELYETLEIVIHCAAVVDFNERLDRAVELNVMGPIRLLEIAKKCKKFLAFVHTSTCYVNCNRPNGDIEEKLYDLGFDPQEAVDQIRKLGKPELDKIAVSGILRNWPNTYTFTKAIGEHLVFKHRGSVPLVIVRPSIIGASWREPVPGWTDVISAAGAVYASVGLGVLKFLPGHGGNIADIIPVDTVVNVMLTVLPSIMGQDKFFICHASSSAEKPTTWDIPTRYIPPYFNAHPPKKRMGTAEFFFVRSPQMYQLAFFLRYSIPSTLLSTLATFGGVYKDQAQLYKKLVFKSRILIDTFRHFTENQWIFFNKNSKNCFYSLPVDEQPLFNCNIADLDWIAYTEAFCFGLLRYVFKEDMIEVSETEKIIRLNDKPEVDSSLEPLRTIAPDVAWAIDNYRSSMLYSKFQTRRTYATMRQLVLSYGSVQEAIQSEAFARKVASSVIQAEAVKIFDKMCGDTNLEVMTGFSYVMRKIWKRIYENIHVNQEGLDALRDISKKGPILFVPTHRSYVDFLVISYICFCQNLPVPCIMAGEDFLGIMLVRWLFRHSGAFFVRRSFADDRLYSAIYNAYVEQLLVDNRSIEFFIEGTRSRSGKMLHPKTGMLSVVSNAFFDKKVSNLHFVPISINYEKTMEGDLYLNELLGEKKVKESLKNLIRSSSVLNINFGTISVRVAPPISLKTYVSTIDRHISTLVSLPQNFLEKSQDATIASVDTGNQMVAFDPFGNKDHRRIVVREFAYHITTQLNAESECMPTHLIATLMLMYRQGLTRELLLSKVEWLRDEIMKRGGKVALAAGYHRQAIITGAMKQLRSVIVERRKDHFEPLVSHDAAQYKNMLVLGHYRNKLFASFFL